MSIIHDTTTQKYCPSHVGKHPSLHFSLQIHVRLFFGPKNGIILHMLIVFPPFQSPTVSSLLIDTHLCISYVS